MKKSLNTTHRLLSALALTLLLCFASSCVKEDMSNNSESPKDGDLYELHLNISNSSADVVTRNVTASDEELAIRRGIIIIFDGKTGAYIDSEMLELGNIFYGDKPSSDPGAVISNHPIIKTPLLSDLKTETHTVVIILNYQSIAFPLEDMFYKDLDKRFALRGRLELKNAIPMYGEAEDWDTKKLIPLTIERSVAKLMVQLKSKGTDPATAVADVGGTHGKNFTIASVKYDVFNNAISGNIRNTTSTEISYSPDNVPPIESISVDNLNSAKGVALDGQNKGPWVSYLYEYPHATTIIGVNKNDEAKIDIDVTSPKRLAVILKVDTGGEGFRYYRLDLAKVNDSGAVEYMDILHNVQYRIVIKSVNDAGHATPEVAFASHPANITYEILDDTGNTTISNGQYAISVGDEMITNVFNTISRSTPSTSSAIVNNVRFILSKNFNSLPDDIINKIEVINMDGSPIYGLTVSPTKLTATSQELRVTWNGEVLKEPKNYTIKIKLGDLVYISPSKFVLVQENNISMKLHSDYLPKFEYYGNYAASRSIVYISGSGSGISSNGGAYEYRVSRVIDEYSTNPAPDNTLMFGSNTSANTLLTTLTMSSNTSFYTKANYYNEPIPTLYKGRMYIDLIRKIDGAVVTSKRITYPLRVMGKYPYVPGDLFPYKTTTNGSKAIIMNSQFAIDAHPALLQWNDCWDHCGSGTYKISIDDGYDLESVGTKMGRVLWATHYPDYNLPNDLLTMWLQPSRSDGKSIVFLTWPTGTMELTSNHSGKHIFRECRCKRLIETYNPS